MKKLPCIYVGRRVTTKHTLAYFWIVEGRERGYAKKNPAPATIGECWTLTFEDDGSTIIGGADAPVRLPPVHGAPPERVKQWAALEVAAKQSLQDAKMRKQLAARKTEFDRALAPLQAMMETLKSNEDRAWFVQAVLVAIWRRAP